MYREGIVNFTELKTYSMIEGSVVEHKPNMVDKLIMLASQFSTKVRVMIWLGQKK